MTIRHTAIAGLAFAAALSLSVISPAQAGGIIETDHYDGSFTDVFRECGTRFQVEQHYWGTSTIRDANRSTGGQFFYFRDRYHLTETVTDLNTGNYIVGSAHGNFRELQPRVVSEDGNTVEYLTKNSGAWWTVRDPDGNLLLRDRGTITERYVFDTLGDSQPGGDFLDYELVSLSGQFPSWEDGAFCSLFD